MNSKTTMKCAGCNKSKAAIECQSCYVRYCMPCLNMTHSEYCKTKRWWKIMSSGSLEICAGCKKSKAVVSCRQCSVSYCMACLNMTHSEYCDA